MPVIKKNQSLINVLNALTDVLLILASYFAAIYTRFYLLHGRVSVDMAQGRYAFIAVAYSVCVVFVFYLLRMYTTYRVRRRTGEYMLIMLVNGIGILSMMTVYFLLRVIHISRLALAIFWAFSSAAIIIKRSAVRAAMQHYRSKGYNQKHVIIVGNGHLAQQYLQDVKRHAYYGFKVAGYVSAIKKPEMGRNLGSYEDLEAVLAKYSPDEVIVALEPHEMVHMPAVLAAADKEGVRISLIPFYNDYIPHYPVIDTLGRTKLIDLRSTPLDNLVWALCKRTMDVVGSLLLILLSSPVMLAVAIGVKLSSPGPIIFRQERVGKDKKKFYMYKFRSMRVTDTEDTGWSVDEDPRKTRFGSLIRKFSLDELPQFFNVLKGDMSLVGPRPEIPFHVNNFKNEVPRYLVRQQIRPGITGWAQINGLRGDTSIKERVEYDLWYIENWSLDLDVKILLRTAFGGMINSEVIASKADGAEQTGHTDKTA